MIILNQLIKLSQRLTFKTQNELRELEDELVNNEGFILNVLNSNIKEHMKYICLTSLPFTLKNEFDHGINEYIYGMWDYTNCIKCSNVVFRRTLPTGNINAEYMIIGDAPGVGNGAKKTLDRALVYGPSSHILRKALIKNKIIHKCWFTNLLKCAKPNNDKSTINNVISCRNYLLNEISIVKPKVIILLGNHVRQQFEHMYPKVFIFNEIKIVKINHPSYIVRSNKTLDMYIEQIKEVIK